jgi:hypothetical protein
MTSAGWASLAVGSAAVAVAAIAFVSNRSFQTRDALMRLLATYEERGFRTRMSRVEQLTRERAGGELDSIGPVDVGELTMSLEGEPPKLRLLRRVLGQDWDVDEAGMHDVYFFALRIDAWLASDRLSRKKRRLNTTFGYQLLSTLLDDRLIAIGLRRENEPADYYATQYGLFDPEHKDLVRRIADDLHRKNAPLPPPIYKALSAKRRATDEQLKKLSPQDSRLTSRLDKAT